MITTPPLLNNKENECTSAPYVYTGQTHFYLVPQYFNKPMQPHSYIYDCYHKFCPSVLAVAATAVAAAAAFCERTQKPISGLIYSDATTRQVIPVQIFLSPPVVLPSLISRFALVQQQIDSNTTGSQKKIGRVLQFAYFSYLSECPRQGSRQVL